MAYATQLSAFAAQRALFTTVNASSAYASTKSGGHGAGNAPSLLYDYATSTHRPTLRTGAMVERGAFRRLREWDKHDSVTPWMHDGKPLVTFSIALHEDDDAARAPGPTSAPPADADAEADVLFAVDDDEPDPESFVTGQAGYKDMQQMGITKQGKVEYITVDDIQRAYDRVIGSLRNLERRTAAVDPFGMADSEWQRRCPNATHMFNVLSLFPYANDRSPDLLVIAHLAVHIPRAHEWLPNLLLEHFEHGVDVDEWRKPMLLDHWQWRVEAYMRRLPEYDAAG